MSLADKLNYLKATKGLIKTAINNKGGTLTDDSSFRSYAEAIDDIGSTMTATAGDIVAGKTAISNSGIITGTSEYDVALIKGYQGAIGGQTITKTLAKIIDLTGITLNTNNLSYIFSGLPELIEIKNMPNPTSATNMSYMFQSCTKLTEIPQQLSTSRATDLTSTFNTCSVLTSIPQLDLGNCTTLSQTFYWCRYLPNITFTNANSVTNLYQTFYECSSLESVSDFGTGLVTNLNSTFYGCSKLITAPYINTASATAMYQTFMYCNELENVPIYVTSNFSGSNAFRDTFKGCPSLSNESLNNIMQMCINATNISTNKTLKFLGLTSTQATTCEGLSNYTAFINAGWTKGY